MTDRAIVDLAFRFKAILDSNERLLNCFCKYGVQLEGWLKGELLCFLDDEKAAARVADFDREVPLGSGRKRVDFRVKMPSRSGEVEAWIELKHWLVGRQKDYKYNAQFYFGDPTSVGIRPDVEKLREVLGGDKFLLILTTANPGVGDWSTGVNKFNKKFSPLHINSLTNPAEFPDSYYLGCLEVSEVRA